MKTSELDPIVAIATPPGRGGIGIVRISGAAVPAVMDGLIGRRIAPRHATFCRFLDGEGEPIDQGIALFFAAPHSYTGEDVLELQGHGGPVVLDLLLKRCLAAGAGQRLRIAAPGEFTRRAFLNDRLDLAQAEAVADLIDASTAAAARSAQASLTGKFSAAVEAILEALIDARMLVEAQLDFPEDEIDGKNDAVVEQRLASLRRAVEHLLDRTTQGALLREGLRIVLAGRPNVGKSSLLNALAEAEVAIVTPIAGTTRDRILQTIQIEGVALHVIDTAGLRESADTVERIGIERSWEEIASADLILNVRDATEPETADDVAIAARLPTGVPRRLVLNKSDLADELPRVDGERIFVSALTGAGIELLREEILAMAGWHASAEPVFLGRARHLDAMRIALDHLRAAADFAVHKERAVELLAEELRLAQDALSSITGPFTPDDLLGEIFSRFCIGK